MSLLSMLGLGRKWRLVLQTEVAECGLACLAMVAHYHGQHHELASLRRRHTLSERGATLASLTEIAEQMGFATRALRLEPGELACVRMPCILHWEFCHFVVLMRIVRRRAIVLDPSRGERRITSRELSDGFTGVALELWPGRRFERRRPAPAIKLTQVLGRVRGAGGALVRIGTPALALEVFSIAMPLLLQWIIDDALLTGSRTLLTNLALAAALLVVGQQLAALARSWVVLHFGTQLNVQWQSNTLRHLLELPHQYFQRRHLGDIVSRFRSIDVIERTLGAALPEALLDGVMSITIAAMLLCYSARLALFPFAAIALYLLARSLTHAPVQRALEEEALHAASKESHLIETVRGARTIKLFARRQVRVSSWVELLVSQINAGLRARKLDIAHRAAQGLLFGLENVLVLWFGATLVLDHELSLGMLIAFLAYKSQLASRLAAFVDELFELRALGVHVARVGDIVLSEPERCGPGQRLALADAAHGGVRLEARGLRFRYSTHERDILDGIELSVEAGESIAIVGDSGSGKTTLLLLLLGVLQPTDGDVLLNGVSLGAAGAEAAQAMASVTQDDTLFAGSIADNISCFDPRADQRWIEHCARLAAIARDIESMPMAYNTHVGYMGGILSGGQQQRVLLARALYKRPRLLLLDEATSHLDLGREADIMRHLRELGMTRIAIAHRPQTIGSADRVLRLANGRLWSAPAAHA